MSGQPSSSRSALVEAEGPQQLRGVPAARPAQREDREATAKRIRPWTEPPQAVISSVVNARGWGYGCGPEPVYMTPPDRPVERANQVLALSVHRVGDPPPASDVFVGVDARPANSPARRRMAQCPR